MALAELTLMSSFYETFSLMAVKASFYLSLRRAEHYLAFSFLLSAADESSASRALRCFALLESISLLYAFGSRK